MTKKQYEETIKAVMEYTTEVINRAKTEQEKINLFTIRNMQIQSITDEFHRTRVD